MWRRGFDIGDGGRLGLQRALRVLGDPSFAVSIDGRRSSCGGGGALGACLGVF